jgi:hypothetical protein
MSRLLALALLATACGQTPKEAKTPPPEVTLYDVTMSTFRGSQLAAHGVADQLVFERSSGDAVAQVAKVVLPPSRPGGEANTVSAPVIRGNLLDRQAFGEGGVTLLGPRQLVGHTPRAHFDGAKLVADGKDPIRVDGPGYRLDAIGFSFALATEEFSFEGPVDGAFGGER